MSREENMRAASRRWKARNAEKCSVYGRAWREANPDKVLAKHSTYRSRNREKLRVWARRDYEKNRVRRAATAFHTNNLRRAIEFRNRNSSFGPHPELSPAEAEACRAIYEECILRSEIMGMKYQVDHIVELRDGGLHHPDNLQIITAQQHADKTWRRQKG